jgi:hypothetical protein
MVLFKFSRVRSSLVLLWVLGVLPCASVGVKAWNADGHMIVAWIAYQHLTAAARERVGALLKLNPQYGSWIAGLPANASADRRRRRAFVQAANWPDFIKGAGGYVSDGSNGGFTPPDSPSASQNIGYADRNRHMYWHFIDLPFSDNGATLEPTPVPNVLTEIVLLRDAVGSPSTSDDIKSYDLVWLIHLVGDLHQPLHAVARFRQTNTDGDNGGNDVKLRCSPAVSCAANLHAEWDGILGNTHDLGVVTAKGGALDARPVPPGADIADPKAWADESMALAREDVYKDLDGAALGDPRATIGLPYVTRARTVAETRVILAGRRLAALLNGALEH